MAAHKRPMGRGRRPKGEGDPRDDILRAALRAFGRRGFDSSSIRTIARSARVNPALVYHYFRSKEALFREGVLRAMGSPPMDFLPRGGSPEEIGTAVVRRFLERWSDPDDGLAFVGLLRSASTSAKAARILRELIGEMVTPYVSAVSGGTDVPRRVALIASTLLGVGLVRFVIGLPGLSSPSPEEIARWIGPTVGRYLVGAP